MRSGLHFLPDLRKQCPPRARQLGEPPSHQKRTLMCLKAPFQRERPRTRFSCLADCPGHGLALPGGRRAELPGEAGGSRRKEWEPEQPWPRLPPVRGRFPLRPASLQCVAAGPAVRPAPRAGLGPSRPPTPQPQTHPLLSLRSQGRAHLSLTMPRGAGEGGVQTALSGARWLSASLSPVMTD